MSAVCCCSFETCRLFGCQNDRRAREKAASNPFQPFAPMRGPAELDPLWPNQTRPFEPINAAEARRIIAEEIAKAMKKPDLEKRIVQPFRRDQFDHDAFFAALDRQRELRNATWKQVSDETGVSVTTLSRMKDCRKPDAASLAALSAWAGINPANFSKANP